MKAARTVLWRRVLITIGVLATFASASVATFVPLTTGVIPFGCGIYERVAGLVVVKIAAQLVVAIGLVVLFRVHTVQASSKRESLTFSAATLLALLGFVYAYFGASLGLDLSSRDCGGVWRNPVLIALFWSSPAIALLLDLTTTHLMRRRRDSAWGVWWSSGCLLLLGAGYWSLSVGT